VAAGTGSGVGGRFAAAALLLLGAWAPHHQAAAQTYQRGQNVAPAFEGWERNEDGSFSFLFGYMNRNWHEQLDVPVGEHNSFSPGPADRGQPTHFLPRRNRFVFKVRVPADWGDKELVWTLTSNGVTERAYASLRPDYIVDNMVFMSETGALGAGHSNAETRGNEPPTITLEGPTERQTTVGSPVTITALVEDDGLLRARRPRPPRLETAADSARADSFWQQAFRCQGDSGRSHSVHNSLENIDLRGMVSVRYDPPLFPAVPLHPPEDG